MTISNIKFDSDNKPTAAGKLRIGLYNKEAHWANDVQDKEKTLKSCKGTVTTVEKKAVVTYSGEIGAYPAIVVPSNAGSITVTYKGVPPGQYAISLFHDEDNDGKMKKNWLGMPKEKYGFSRNFNPNSKLRAPKFNECVFTVKEGNNAQQINLR